MRTIRLTIFNEDYWSKGLIYTQNVLTLKILSNSNSCKLEIISFTSLFMYLRNYSQIRQFKAEMESSGIKVRNFITLYYPTRLLIARWYVLPFLFLNTMAYILYLSIKDNNKDVVYNLRSYQVALAFCFFYTQKDKLIFDPRTDWIEENINSGNFRSAGFNVFLWNKFEK